MKTTMTKEMADRKVNDAIAVLWQVEMGLNEAEREYRAALDRLHAAQEERDRLDKLE